MLPPNKNKSIEEYVDTDNSFHQKLPGSPKIVSRDDHVVSRRDIDQDALKVLRRLNGYGYQAFLVGGGVRDLLIGKEPKDFDVCTDAHPEEIRDLFRNSRIIGKRFKLVHVYFYGGKIIEVSTFRAANDSTSTLSSDNNYGDALSDALRRDLTINALFYSPEDFSIIDYVDGLKDLDKKVVRIIGDPDVRFTEDPVRIIRAARHAARANFQIEKKTASSMKKNIELLNLVPAARLYEEIQKDFYSGSFLETFEELRKFDIIKLMLPNIDEAINTMTKEKRSEYLGRLKSLDTIIQMGLEPPSELFFGCLLIGAVAKKNKLKNSELSLEDNSDEYKLEILAEEFPCHVSDSGKSSSDAQLDVFRLKPLRRDRNSRDRVSGIAKAIGNWFLPCTLTKREKLSLERLLTIRYNILTAEESDTKNLIQILKDLHSEERLTLKLLFEILGDNLPKIFKNLLQETKIEVIQPNSIKQGVRSSVQPSIKQDIKPGIHPRSNTPKMKREASKAKESRNK